ncbi:tubulin-folding cofactor B [Sitophilus oryzae]|uniref:Tubulin-folding cofactor B n=1 Tax=Sitophilus oryzae TaxID=7048 RepID=A0A6J2XWZ2_SITOR|nr:tubulin-folding cofactor B [Sitophilus oryzae]
MGDIKIITSDFLHLQVSTSQDDISFGEKRFPKDLTISDLKAKLELMTGGNCNTMRIEAYNKDNKLVASLDDNKQVLGFYPIDDGMRLHVIDDFQLRSEFDSANVPKFELSEEEYSKRGDSVKTFLMKNKMGKYNEEYVKKKEQQESEEKSQAENMKVGSRCKVTVSNAPTRLGTIMYSGGIDGLTGSWIGIKYDEPVGKHDGSIKGKRYFQCPDKYGAFVKPSCVLIGEFPEEDYDLNEEL